MSTYKIINPAAIAENLMHSPDLIKQFMELYQTQIPEDFQHLRHAVASKDHADIADRTHHIKPTMEYIGATTLRVKLQDMEQAGKEKMDFALIDQKMNAIETEYSILMQEIDQYLATL